MEGSINPIFKLSFFCVCLVAFTNISAQNTYALIVGISQYKEMPALQYADRDAIAFAEFVKGQGAPDQNIKLFLNEEASRLNIVDELYKLSQIAKPQDLFYFYFGGHGDLEANVSNENTLLLLHDAPAKSYFKGDAFLQVSELKNWLSTLSKKQVQVVFIADACHSGGLIGGNEGQVRTQQVLEENWGNVTKILSSQASELSLEGQQWGGGRGLFSYHLVNGLIGKADANQNKLVSLEELDTYLLNNVTKEASPNLQTPLVLGEKKRLLAKVNQEALKKLLDTEQLSFPIISSANLKANLEDLLAQLDASLVTTYKKFAQALKDKRINIFDDETDYALLHYQILANAKVPEHLLQIMKRNLGAGLMERELAIMQNAREKAYGGGFFAEPDLIRAIQNIEEIQKLFGKMHYLSPLLEARSLVLQSKIGLRKAPTNLDVDQTLEMIRTVAKEEKALLLRSLQLEPKMVSTYLLLGFAYQRTRQIDSSRYYQEKVMELMPNESRAHFAVGNNYLRINYKDSTGRVVPHPKAIDHLEKALKLEPTALNVLRSLGEIYFDAFRETYTNYPKAILYYEKHLQLLQAPHRELMKKNLSYAEEGAYSDLEGHIDSVADKFVSQIVDHAVLYLLYKNTGNNMQAVQHRQHLHQISDSVGTVLAYMTVALRMYRLATRDKFSFFEQHLSEALFFQQKALQKVETDLKTLDSADKLDAMLVHREILKSLGVTYRLLKDHAQAEKYLQQALNHPVKASVPKHYRYIGSSCSILDSLNTQVTQPSGIDKYDADNCDYRVEPNEEMFHLKWAQGDVEAAFSWLEKAFQQSLAELGNDISTEAFEATVFELYPSLDQTRFKTLKAKYFPPINAEKK